MIRADQIPPEVVEAAQEAFWDASGTANDCLVHAIAAALNAWPGFEYRADVAFPAFGYGPAAIILPLPQEEKGGQ